MPSVQDRRVRSLRLAAAGEDELWRGRVLFEDALHIASLPGASSGRLLIVRHFSLGRLSTRRSSSDLAGLIDRRFLELSSQMVHADHPNAASQSVVYFCDEFEPYIMLAVRIAGGEDTSSWFWPLAAKGWQPTMSRSEGLRAVLYQLAEIQAGPVGVTALVCELCRRNRMDPLLASLETSDGERLMQRCDWVKPSPRSEPPEILDETLAVELSAADYHVLQRWLKRWTTSDARSIWLAAVLLVEQRPARFLDRQLIQRALSLIEAISTSPLSTWTSSVELSGADQRQVLPGTPTTGAASGYGDRRSGGLPVISNALARTARKNQQTSDLASGPGDASSGSLLPETFDLGANPGDEALIAVPNRRRETSPETDTRRDASRNATRANQEETDSGAGAHSLSSRAKSEAVTPDDGTSGSSSPDVARIPNLRDTMQIQKGTSSDADQARHAQTLPNARKLRQPSRSQQHGLPVAEGAASVIPHSPADSTRSSEAIDALNQSELERDRPGVSWAKAAQVTEFGGFYFLLALVSRLNIVDFLEHNQGLIELDFPQRLLRFAAEQLQIPVEDPVMTPFRSLRDSPPQEIEFSVPRIWRDQLYRSGPLVLSAIDGRPRYRLLSDRSGRNVLSIWRGGAPEGVRRLIGRSRIKRANARRCEDDMRELLDSWYRAMSRWCHCYAGLKIDELVHRRGLIAVTRTHLDLFFDLRSVSIRIRRAGMDLDLGWVPWLGRVVSFHYVERKEIDGGD